MLLDNNTVTPGPVSVVLCRLIMNQREHQSGTCTEGRILLGKSVMTKLESFGDK